MNPEMSFGSVGNNPSKYCGVPHLTLLKPLPTIGMGENHFDRVLKGRPEIGAVQASLDDVLFCALENVCVKVREDLNGSLPTGKLMAGVEVVEFDVLLHGRREEVQLKP